MIKKLFKIFFILFHIFICAEEKSANENNSYLIIKFKEVLNKDALINNNLPNPLDKSRVFQYLSYQKPFVKTDNSKKERQAFGIDRLHIYKNISNINSRQLAIQLSNDPLIEYAIQKPIYKETDIPNDVIWNNQEFYMKYLNFHRAWDNVKGEDGNVVIAIVDGAVDWRHEDLYQNVWNNPNEIPDNGLDDDNNGYMDDIVGWNFHNDTNDPFLSNSSHGTRVATTASATTNNNSGIAGAAWNAKIMSIAAACDDVGYICYGGEGAIYAAENGADIINASYGRVLEGANQFEEEALYSLSKDIYGYATSLGALVVNSAGNSGLDHDYNPHFPSMVTEVLSVGATNGNNPLIPAGFTNYGISVDVFAPGVGIRTGTLNNAYTSSNGTSFSAPIVSGIAALVKTQFPDLSPAELQAKIRVSTTFLSSFSKLGQGLVDAEKAVLQTNSPSIQLHNVKVFDNNDGKFKNNETIFIECEFINYLNDATNVTINISSDNSNINFEKPNLNISQITKGDTLKHIFSFTTSGIDTDSQALIIFSLNADFDYFDRFIKKVYLNPSSVLNHNTGITQLSITENGNIGFTGFADESYGLGFLYNNKNYLFEGGLIIATGPNNVSDGLRRNSSQRKDDFKPKSDSTIKIIYKPDQITKEIGLVSISDVNANRPIPINIDQVTYADTNDVNDDFIIIKYKISSKIDRQISNLFAGIFIDWDINANASDYVDYKSDKKLGFAFNRENEPNEIAGVVVLSDSYGSNAINFKAINNSLEIYSGNSGDGFTDEEKWQFLSGGIQTPFLYGLDVSMISSIGPIFIEPGDTAEIAFALVGGNSLDDFYSNVDNAKSLWENKIAPIQEYAPEFQSLISYITINSVEKIEIDFIVNDRDGDLIEFSLFQPVLNASIEKNTGRFIFKPNINQIGSFKFKIIASDGRFKTIKELTVNVKETLFKISDVYKNPFNPLNEKTKVDFQFPELTPLTIRIFNIMGQEVKTINNRIYQPGKHHFIWDGKNNNYSIVPSGVYFISVNSKFDHIVKKVVVRN